MDRKETTKFLGELLERQYLSGLGKHWAKEVNIDPGSARTHRRIDYMLFQPAGQCNISDIEKGIFTCYEIKSCKADVYSGNGLNFIGEKNYIVTTMQCYKDIKIIHTQSITARMCGRLIQLKRAGDILWRWRGSPQTASISLRQKAENQKISLFVAWLGLPAAGRDWCARE